jgi:hypothetical protein
MYAAYQDALLAATCPNANMLIKPAAALTRTPGDSKITSDNTAAADAKRIQNHMQCHTTYSKTPSSPGSSSLLHCCGYSQQASHHWLQHN